MIPIVLGALAISTGAVAQTNEEIIDRALTAAPRNMHDGATVIKWKADYTYETLKKGTNQLVCYDRSGEAGRPAFAVQCTSLGNLPRVAQNRKFEAIADKNARQAAIDAAEKDGTRVKPVFGSVFISVSGPDKEHVHQAHHDRRAGGDQRIAGNARHPRSRRRVGHESRDDDGAHHDAWQLA